MKTPPPSITPLLTVADIATRLQLSEKSVRRAINAKELQAHRIGRAIRITETDLSVFIDRHRQ